MSDNARVILSKSTTVNTEPAFRFKYDHMLGNFVPNLDLATQQKEGFSVSQEEKKSSVSNKALNPERKLNPVPNNTEPFLQILVQPQNNGFRFRYVSEGKISGSIHGENSSVRRETFPTVKICNFDGHTAVIVMSTVTSDPPPNCTPHPHSLVGRDCKSGVCTVRVRNTKVVSFPHVQIQCTTKKEVEEALQKRKNTQVDPFFNAASANPTTIDMSELCLCFQTFLPDDDNRIRRALPVVVSKPIKDQRIRNRLIIKRVSIDKGMVHGNDEMFIICRED